MSKLEAALLFQVLLLSVGAELDPPDPSLYGYEPHSVFAPFTFRARDVEHG